MKVTSSAYYCHVKKQKVAPIDKDIKLIIELKVLHKQSNASYGSRRMSKALSMRGLNVGRCKIRRLMHQNGLKCKQRQRYTITTNSNHSLAAADNILNRNFYAEAPNKKWVSDITYLWTAEGNCWDNAVMERFFGSLKAERTDGKFYTTRAEAKADVVDYIERFYNLQRLHSTLNYVSPIAYEMEYKHTHVRNH